MVRMLVLGIRMVLVSDLRVTIHARRRRDLVAHRQGGRGAGEQ
jgi:hypothetical protein